MKWLATASSLIVICHFVLGFLHEKVICLLLIITALGCRGLFLTATILCQLTSAAGASGFNGLIIFKVSISRCPLILHLESDNQRRKVGKSLINRVRLRQAHMICSCELSFFASLVLQIFQPLLVIMRNLSHMIYEKGNRIRWLVYGLCWLFEFLSPEWCSVKTTSLDLNNLFKLTSSKWTNFHYCRLQYMPPHASYIAAGRSTPD